MIPIHQLPLLLSALLVGNRTPAPSELPACALTMTPVSVRGVSYLAALTVSPSCPASRVFRVRKTSTLNTRSKGAPYQPIRPDGSLDAGGLFSWSISKRTSNIPPSELWTSFTWDWQVYDAHTWNARTHEYGAWQRIPQPVWP